LYHKILGFANAKHQHHSASPTFPLMTLRVLPSFLTDSSRVRTTSLRFVVGSLDMAHLVMSHQWPTSSGVSGRPEPPPTTGFASPPINDASRPSFLLDWLVPSPNNFATLRCGQH